jgi:hypothetical protein
MNREEKKYLYGIMMKHPKYHELIKSAYKLSYSIYRGILKSN